MGILGQYFKLVGDNEVVGMVALGRVRESTVGCWDLGLVAAVIMEVTICDWLKRVFLVSIDK